MKNHARILNELYTTAVDVMTNGDPLPPVKLRMIALYETVEAYVDCSNRFPNQIDRVAALQAIVNFQRVKSRELLGSAML